MKIFKFGGASVKDAEGVKNLSAIIARYNEPVVVVVSAMGKMTNAFEVLVKHYCNHDKRAWEQFELIKNFHYEIITQLFAPDDDVNTEIDSIFFRIEDRLDRKPSLEYDFEYDQFVCYGELISTRIVSAYLNLQEIKNQWIDIRNYLKTDDTWRDASVEWDISEKLVKEAFNFEDTKLYLTQGFIGSTMTDLTTTLGREGSDYTAAILGSILDADKVEIWKDVPGILNADPQYFPNPVKIDRMSYREAVELTFFGAKVIHPKTIKPLHNKNIPLQVRSFLNPEESGTLIDNYKSDPNEYKLPVFVLKTNQVLITLSQPDFSFMSEESLAWVFEIFATLNMKVNLVQHSALNLTVSVNIPEKGVVELIELLSEQFEVRYNEGLELITIRHYTQEVIDEVLEGRMMFVQQRSRRIARFLVRQKSQVH